MRPPPEREVVLPAESWKPVPHSKWRMPQAQDSMHQSGGATASDVVDVPLMPSPGTA